MIRFKKLLFPLNNTTHNQKIAHELVLTLESQTQGVSKNISAKLLTLTSQTEVVVYLSEVRKTLEYLELFLPTPNILFVGSYPELPIPTKITVSDPVEQGLIDNIDILLQDVDSAYTSLKDLFKQELKTFLFSEQDLQDNLKGYTDLLIKQYYRKDKATATIKALLAPLLCNDKALKTIENSFKIYENTGELLNGIGEAVGINRFFNWTNNTAVANDYPAVTTTNPITDISRFGSQKYLTDMQFKMLIFLKIISNCSNHSICDINEKLLWFFGGGMYCETVNDMDLTYRIVVDREDLDLFALIKVAMVASSVKNCVPRPTAVNTLISLALKKPIFSVQRSFQTVDSNGNYIRWNILNHPFIIGITKSYAESLLGLTLSRNNFTV